MHDDPYEGDNLGSNPPTGVVRGGWRHPGRDKLDEKRCMHHKNKQDSVHCIPKESDKQ